MGKRVKCPQCGTAVQVLGSDADDRSDEAYSLAPTCPKCKRELAKGAVLCIACGFNLKTGKKLGTVIKESEHPIGPHRLRICIIRGRKGKLTLVRPPGCLFFFRGPQRIDLTGYKSIVVNWFDNDSDSVTTVDLAGPDKRSIRIWQSFDIRPGADDEKNEVIDDLKAATGFQITSGRD